MNAYVSTELSMIQMLDPQRRKLALLQEAFLNKGGTIEVLRGPSFMPPPVRHEPPPTARSAPVHRTAEPIKIDRLTQRDIDREERAQAKIDLEDRIRKLAATMTQAEVETQSGIHRRKLHSIAKANGFTFKKSSYIPSSNLRPAAVDEAKDAKDAERIKAFKEIGLTRNQAMEKIGISFTAFTRILSNFEIDYPKSSRGGPRPAFHAKSANPS